MIVGGRTDEQCVAQLSVYNHETNTIDATQDLKPPMTVARRLVFFCQKKKREKRENWIKIA